jgi:peptide/nickel transport system permease protein
MSVAQPVDQSPRWPIRLLRPSSLLGRLIREPGGVLGLAVVATSILVAIFAPLIAPEDPDQIDVMNRFSPPTRDHLLGTDYIGRDILSRLIYGDRIAISIAFPAVLIGFFVGILFGLIAGWRQGVMDKCIMGVSDIILVFPGLILAVALLTLLGPSVVNILIVLAIAQVPVYVRLMRAQVLTVRTQAYIKAERAIGLSEGRLVLRHVIPNALPALLVVIAMDIPAVIGSEAGLAFLGLGVQPPTPDWGVMLNDGFQYLRISAWPLIWPLVVLMVVTTGFVVFGETLRRLVDPRGETRAVRRRRKRTKTKW